MTKSATTINPFKTYIRALIDNLDKTTIPKKMNLILDGGAFNGGYMAGMLLYLMEMKNLKITSIEKISGTSIGAICAIGFFANAPDYAIKVFDRLIKSLRKTLCLSEIIPLIKELVDMVDISKLDNKLFITYYDVINMKQIVVSTYPNKEMLIDTVIKSCFVPYLMDGNVTYNDRYCDGCTPYVFKKDTIPSMFISLHGIKNIGNMLYTKNEVNIWTRLLYVVVDINGFFMNNKSEFCSFVDKWNILDFHIFHFREIICFILIIFLHYSTYINNKMPDTIKSNKYLLRIIEIVSTLYKTIFSYIIL
jgi:hypothetical protein